MFSDNTKALTGYADYIRQRLSPSQPPPMQQQPAGQGPSVGAFGGSQPGAMPAQGGGPIEPPQGGGALGMSQAPAAPSQSTGGAFSQQTQAERQKIPILPAGMKPEDLKFKKGAVEQVKTPADLMNALEPSSSARFLSAWEKERGSIDDKYSYMLRELGQRPDANKKLTKQDKFAMLMEGGLNLIKFSQRGSGNSLGGAIAQSVGATFAGQRQKELAAPEQFDKRKGALLGARSAELKELGSRSGALKDASTIDRNDAAAVRDRGYAGEVVGTENLDSGVVGRTRGGALQTMTDPNTGKPAKRDPKAAGSAASTSYEIEHGYMTRMYQRNGKMTQEQAEDAATKEMQRRGTSGGKSVRRLAGEYVKEILSGSDEWKNAKPDERVILKEQMMEDERKQAIKEAYGIDLDEKMYGGLGATVGLGSMDRKPSEDDIAELRADPGAAIEFYEFFGTLPDDFWPE